MSVDGLIKAGASKVGTAQVVALRRMREERLNLGVQLVEEQLQLLERRDTILEYLDRLVAERGYDKVVIHD